MLFGQLMVIFMADLNELLVFCAKKKHIPDLCQRFLWWDWLRWLKLVKNGKISYVFMKMLCFY